MKFRVSAIMFALAPAMMLAQAPAQRVSGTVRDESGALVRGAIVSAFSGKDTTAVTLSRTDGSFQLAFPRKGLTLLVRAIGLQPVRIPLSAGTDTVVSIRMTRIAFRLDAVRVNEFTSCAKSQTGTTNIVDVWLEVTKALEGTRIVRDSGKRVFGYNLYELETNAVSGRSYFLKNDTSSWLAKRPFKVTPPKELASEGYVIVDPAKRDALRNKPDTEWISSLWYRAPDEMVLLDETFQKTHCFWASNGGGVNQGMIGVNFMPVSGIKTNDIRGVFWIDASSYELKRLDFLYTQIIREPISRRNAAAIEPSPSADSTTGLEPSLKNPVPGGILDFARLNDGSFIIPQWRIFVNDTWTAHSAPGESLRKPRRMKETGGLVLSVSGG